MTTAPKDFVELVIPTYRRPAALSCAVESALSETTFPITVLDDNSPEPAAETLDATQLAEIHGDRLRIVRNEYNLGASLNILRALEVSRAAFTWPFSDDRVVTKQAADEVAAAIGEHPNASIFYWNRGLARDERIDIAGLQPYLELIERGRSVFGFSDNHYHRVVRTSVGRRYVRQDARFSHAQPMLGIQIAALADGHLMHVRGGEVSGHQAGSARSWSAGYTHRFKFDPAYLIPDANLRRRYRAVAAKHFPWKKELIAPPAGREQSVDAEFAADAAMLVTHSKVPIRLRAEARLALLLGTTRMGRSVTRMLRSREKNGEALPFEEMSW